MQLSYRSIDIFWEKSRRLGVLTQLYRERVDDWRLLKCARAYAKHVGEVRNAKLLRLLGQIFAWIRVRMSDAYRRTRERRRELSQAGKFRLGVWGSAGFGSRGELLRLYLGLKNTKVPAQLLVDLYYYGKRIRSAFATAVESDLRKAGNDNWRRSGNLCLWCLLATREKRYAVSII